MLRDVGERDRGSVHERQEVRMRKGERDAGKREREERELRTNEHESQPGWLTQWKQERERERRGVAK